MPNSRYVRGNSPIYRFKLFNTAGGAVDPTGAIIFKSLSPDNTETTYTYGVGAQIVKSGTGDYYVRIPLGTKKLAGKYICRWEAYNSDGSVMAADEKTIETVSDYKEAQL